ncbi:MAG TPA: inorganic phosphate transporter, partial [Chryseobacterium sp.]
LPIGVGASLVLAVLLAAIIWNLGTWYFGIPCSSSHTLIGSLIGAGLGFTWYYGGSGVNWHKAEEIGLSLILSPLVGFGLAILLMLFFKYVVRYKALFHIPTGENDKPPVVIRVILIITCTLVSFFHGSNDGQKGVGLFMLILIAFLPAKFAINHEIPNDKIIANLNQTEVVLNKIAASNGNTAEFTVLNGKIEAVKNQLAHKNENNKQATYKFRKEVESLTKSVKELTENKAVKINENNKLALDKEVSELKSLTEFAPIWVIITISIALGLGTTIGWKRIAVTIGEKIGNEHLNYAQGASSELVAASTIGISTFLGLPVSTTHVLSSGIAGSMVASGGKSNLNPATLKSIGLAWVLTLPVSIILSLALFTVFHLFI